jgi:Coenzyme PQQ synthesis protein D (PqqD)
MTTPKRAETVHVEQLGEELCIYDWQRKEVHALNPTAARVWQQCDGQTSPEQIAERLAAAVPVLNSDTKGYELGKLPGLAYNTNSYRQRKASKP